MLVPRRHCGRNGVLRVTDYDVKQFDCNITHSQREEFSLRWVVPVDSRQRENSGSDDRPPAGFLCAPRCIRPSWKACSPTPHLRRQPEQGGLEISSFPELSPFISKNVREVSRTKKIRRDRSAASGHEADLRMTWPPNEGSRCSIVGSGWTLRQYSGKELTVRRGLKVFALEPLGMRSTPMIIRCASS